MTFPDTLGVGDRAATCPWMVLTVPWFFLVWQFFRLWKNLSHLEQYGIKHVFFRSDFVVVEGFGTATSCTLTITDGCCLQFGLDKISVNYYI